jgi:hypothetical protein
MNQICYWAHIKDLRARGVATRAYTGTRAACPSAASTLLRNAIPPFVDGLWFSGHDHADRLSSRCTPRARSSGMSSAPSTFRRRSASRRRRSAGRSRTRCRRGELQDHLQGRGHDGGPMAVPDGHAAIVPGSPGHISVADVDAMLKRVTGLGGTVLRRPRTCRRTASAASPSLPTRKGCPSRSSRGGAGTGQVWMHE